MAWGGGETPALAGIVEAGRIDLAASCTGLVNPKERLSLGDKLGPGDAIVLLASSGIHANGLSLARKLAERLPQGYLTEVAPGLGYGEALLAPTTTLKSAELEGDYTTRLALMEELKLLPFGAVWDHYCATQGVPVGESWLADWRPGDVF